MYNEDKAVLHSLIWKCCISRYCKSKMKNKLNKHSKVSIQFLFNLNSPVSFIVFKLKFNMCVLTLQVQICTKRFLNLIKLDEISIAYCH